MAKAFGNAVPALAADELPTGGPDRRRHHPAARRRWHPATDGTVDLGGGYGFQVPDGYEVEQQGDGYAMVFGDGGYFFALLTPAARRHRDDDHRPPDRAAGAGHPGPRRSATPRRSRSRRSSVVVCVMLGYQGLLADQQGGSTPVEGFAYYFQLQDGTGVTAFALYQQGSVTEDSPLVEGYNTMLNSLVSTF